MVVDVIIPVYRPEREKLTKLIDWLNKQTVKPSHVFFMQTLVEEKEDEEVLQMLQKAENVEIVPIEKKDFDHGGTRNKGAALRIWYGQWKRKKPQQPMEDSCRMTRLV